MGICVISDAASSIRSGFGYFLINRSQNVLSVSDSSSDQAQQSLPQFRMSVSLPPTKPLTRKRLRKVRSVKRKTLDGDDGEDNELLFLVMVRTWNREWVQWSGGGGGGGGKGWNFGGNGDPNWGDFGYNSLYDPAFDFVYRILCWIAMSNCLHFSFRKVLRFVESSFIDRGKVSLPLAQVC